MSLLFCDGFDHYKALYLKWDYKLITGNLNDMYAQILQIGRDGRGGVRIPQCRGGAPLANQLVKNIPAQSTLIFGMAFYWDPANFGAGQNQGQDSSVLQLWDGSTIQVDLRITSTGTFYFLRDNTSIGSVSTNAYPVRTFRYLEVKIVIASGTSGSVELRVDGTNSGWINSGSLNTQASSNASATQFRIGSYVRNTNSVGYGGYWDDLYLCNTAGSTCNTFLGDQAVRGQNPTADGSTQQFTMNALTWTATAIKGLGQVILDSNGKLQQVSSVTGDSLTGGSAPTWSTTTGATTTDNHVTWTCLGAESQWLIASRQGNTTGMDDWQQRTHYEVGATIVDYNKNVQILTTGGSGGSITSNFEVAWNPVVGGTTSDNANSAGYVWTNLGPPEDCYLSDSTVGHISRFTYPAITGNTVKAVVAWILARKNDAGARSIRGATKSGGTAYDSGTDLPLSAQQIFQPGIFETDPATSAAWSVSGVNAAEFGAKLTV